MIKITDGREQITLLATSVGSCFLLFAEPTSALLLMQAAVLFVLIAWISLRDIRQFEIPDGPVLALGCLAIAGRLQLSGADIVNELPLVILDGTIGGAAFLAVREVYFRFRNIDGLGLGDVKLAFVTGLLIGSVGLAWSVFLASALGLLIVVFFKIFWPTVHIQKLPFGALLAPICWLIWLHGLELMW